MTLLADVARHLETSGVSFAVVGAAALSVHGISRSTADIDLMVVDRRVLTRELWSDFTGVAPDLRVGDFDDPLAGVVRLRGTEARALDIVVAKHRFVGDVLTRAEAGYVSGVLVPVVRLADLVLLKLFAGGPQDAWDIEQALIAGGAEVGSEVDERIGDLPADARELWTRIRR